MIKINLKLKLYFKKIDYLFIDIDNFYSLVHHLALFYRIDIILGKRREKKEDFVFFLVFKSSISDHYHILSR